MINANITMKDYDKANTEKSLQEIASGQFDSRSVEQVFLALREYAEGFPTFREVANYVAHSKHREDGVTNTVLESSYYAMKFEADFGQDKEPLDFHNLPHWVFKHLINQVDKYDEKELQRMFHGKKSAIASRLKNIYKIDKEKNIATPRKSFLQKKDVILIEHLLKYIIYGAAFTEEQIMEGLISVCQNNGLRADYEKIKEQSDKIILFVIAKIHDTTHTLPFKNTGKCQLTCSKPATCYTRKNFELAGDTIEVMHDFGYLQLNGSVPYKSKEKSIIISCPILTTKLKITDWCDENVRTLEKSIHNEPIVCINFDKPIHVRDFKISITP